ncbi:MAG: SsrA-binding protein SmpB [Candidatus Buchananbacteria bacterium]|nr:SsrA-binding protein SmpB [Candidatus Buchananbacteria bacterium]
MPTLALNKKAKFDYKIQEEIEAGIVLTGPEVKSTKASQISLKGSYITIDHKSNAWLVGAHISPYKPAKNSQINYSPTHDRALLLTKKEIDYLRGKEKEKGLTILPLSVYTKGGLIKVKIALAVGKKKFDKRESIKKRDLDRQIRRTLNKR